MKLWQSLFLVVLLLTLPLMGACTPQSKISADETIAIVQEYVYAKESAWIYFGGVWDASYEGKGKWLVVCLTPVNKSFLESAPELKEEYERLYAARIYGWNYYENSGVVQFKPLSRESAEYNALLHKYDEKYGPLPKEFWGN